MRPICRLLAKSLNTLEKVVGYQKPFTGKLFFDNGLNGFDLHRTDDVQFHQAVHSSRKIFRNENNYEMVRAVMIMLVKLIESVTIIYVKYFFKTDETLE